MKVYIMNYSVDGYEVLLVNDDKSLNIVERFPESGIPGIPNKFFYKAWLNENGEIERKISVYDFESDDDWLNRYNSDEFKSYELY